MDVGALQNSLDILNNLNQMIVNVIATTINKDKRKEIENAIHGQLILAPDEAIKLGLVQEVRPSFMEREATIISDVAAPNAGTIASTAWPTSIIQITPAVSGNSPSTEQ